MIITGLVVGMRGWAAVLLVKYGKPRQHSFCIACFLREILLVSKPNTLPSVQYARPEIIGNLFFIYYVRLREKSSRFAAVHHR